MLALHNRYDKYTNNFILRTWMIWYHHLLFTLFWNTYINIRHRVYIYIQFIHCMSVLISEKFGNYLFWLNSFIWFSREELELGHGGRGCFKNMEKACLGDEKHNIRSRYDKMGLNPEEQVFITFANSAVVLLYLFLKCILERMFIG